MYYVLGSTTWFSVLGDSMIVCTEILMFVLGNITHANMFQN